MNKEERKVEYTFLWFVENYANCWHKNGERLLSPDFTADEREGTSWRMRVYPRGDRDVVKGYISLFLGRRWSDEGPETVLLNFELSVFAADGSTLRSEVSKNTFEKGKRRGWPAFVEMEKIPRGTLTVRCRTWKGEGKVFNSSTICARTRIAVENVSFLHVVENFSTLEPNQKRTIEIPSRSEKGFVASSSLYFDDAGEMIVEITSSDSHHNLCKRKIFLSDASGNIIACGESDNRLDAEGKDIRKLPLSFGREVILNKKSEYLPGDKLTLVCECVFSTGLEFEKIEETRHETPKEGVELADNSPPNQNTAGKASALPSVVEDIKALYLNQLLTDVEFETKTKSFKAHKSILCTRSPVFDAMMTDDTREKSTNCIQVDDLGDDIVQQMLLFLYCDEIENLEWNTATRLYRAGDKYQIGRLKEVCSSFLLEHLTTANAVELLVLADDHSDSGLQKTVEEFILRHERDVFGSKEWEMLMRTNPLLAMTTMHLKYKR